MSKTHILRRDDICPSNIVVFLWLLTVQSPLSREPIKADENYLPPLGLGYIATYLNEAEINVEVVDCIREKISVSKIISYVNNIHPDFVGINIFTQNYEIVKYIIENIDVGIDCFIGGQAVKSIYDDIISRNTDNRLRQYHTITGCAFFIPSLDYFPPYCPKIPRNTSSITSSFLVNLTKNSRRD